MIPTLSNDYLWYLSFRGKQKSWKTRKKKPNTKFFPIFIGRNKKSRIIQVSSARAIGKSSGILEIKFDKGNENWMKKKWFLLRMFYEKKL